MLDDGRLTDGQGRTVDFKTAVIIVTSNIGSRYWLDGMSGASIPEAVRESVMAELRNDPTGIHNRIDGTILFKALAVEKITSIVEVLLVDLNKRSPTVALLWHSARMRTLRRSPEMQACAMAASSLGPVP